MYKTILILICIFILICIYLSHNINTLEIAQYTIKNKKIPKEFDGYNIVQISDLHSKSFGKNNIKLLQKIKYLNPDIIVITGDLVDGENNNYDIALNFMKELTKLYKVYYIIGNHEQKALIKKYKQEYIKYFEELNQIDFINLDDDKVKIQKNNSLRLWNEYKQNFDCFQRAIKYNQYKGLIGSGKNYLFLKNFTYNRISF